jgi:hypothetical protein
MGVIYSYEEAFNAWRSQAAATHEVVAKTLLGRANLIGVAQLADAFSRAHLSARSSAPQQDAVRESGDKSPHSIDGREGLSVGGEWVLLFNFARRRRQLPVHGSTA